MEQLRTVDVPAVLGDAADPMVLAQAHVARAAVLIIATPDTLRARQMVDCARTLNPDIAIIIRSHSEMEAALLTEQAACTVLLGERELAHSMSQHTIDALRKTAPAHKTEPSQET